MSRADALRTFKNAYRVVDNALENLQENGDVDMDLLEAIVQTQMVMQIYRAERVDPLVHVHVLSGFKPNSYVDVYVSHLLQLQWPVCGQPFPGASSSGTSSQSWLLFLPIIMLQLALLDPTQFPRGMSLMQRKEMLCY
ncbi:hypothetical protein MAR_028011 [Mya arenaria]|uniref:Uncharacterized protein n=1 Tax=Mya arenaria TaxID=6604 RepID=A0ABY7DE83_MYAAR|nr:hypothetical protein MAR_028011 [Mya arenaria]